MAVFFLPLGAILSTSLIAQIEYKNNTWKQLHTLPLSYTTIFFAKLTVIIVLMLQFFALFNLGIYLSAVVPYLLVGGTPYPAQPLPYALFLNENLLFFVDTLPIVALQYLISLRFKNFLFLSVWDLCSGSVHSVLFRGSSGILSVYISDVQLSKRR
jgi:hypothetical protein